MDIKRIIKQEWLQLLILIAPFAAIVLFWDRFPERIPIHWNFNGYANGYADKWVGLLLIPAINIGLVALLGSLGRLDPKVHSINLPAGGMKPMRLVLSIFLLTIFLFTTIAPAAGVEINVGDFFPIVLSLLFFAIGNYLPTVKPNYFIGVRTPWTLDSPENWRLTHQFTGKLWVVASIVYFVLNLVVPAEVRHSFFGIYLGVLIVPPLVYSYLFFQKSKRA